MYTCMYIQMWLKGIHVCTFRFSQFHVSVLSPTYIVLCRHSHTMQQYNNIIFSFIYMYIHIYMYTCIVCSIPPSIYTHTRHTYVYMHVRVNFCQCCTTLRVLTVIIWSPDNKPCYDVILFCVLCTVYTPQVNCYPLFTFFTFLPHIFHSRVFIIFRMGHTVYHT